MHADSACHCAGRCGYLECACTHFAAACSGGVCAVVAGTRHSVLAAGVCKHAAYCMYGRSMISTLCRKAGNVPL